MDEYDEVEEENEVELVGVDLDFAVVEGNILLEERLDDIFLIGFSVDILFDEYEVVVNLELLIKVLVVCFNCSIGEE